MSVTQLVYCASPARLSEQKHEIMRFVISKGKAPLHPFNALPIEYFETEAINRADTLGLCCKLIDACDEFWLFGISEGTLTEAKYFLEQNNTKPRPLKILVSNFDPDYKIYTQQFRNRFADTLSNLAL